MGMTHLKVKKYLFYSVATLAHKVAEPCQSFSDGHNHKLFNPAPRG
jgi:hypothetical protein